MGSEMCIRDSFGTTAQGVIPTVHSFLLTTISGFGPTFHVAARTVRVLEHGRYYTSIVKWHKKWAFTIGNTNNSMTTRLKTLKLIRIRFVKGREKRQTIFNNATNTRTIN